MTDQELAGRKLLERSAKVLRSMADDIDQRIADYDKFNRASVLLWSVTDFHDILVKLQLRDVVLCAAKCVGRCFGRLF